MAIKSLTQGQGESTEFKERGLQAAFTINLRIFQAKFGNRYRYFHFDLNSGSGMNEIVKCIGSPLAFLKAVQETGCNNFFAGFCDKESSLLETLFHRTELQHESCFAFNGDNQDLLYAIPDIIRYYQENPFYALGMILVDPNGADIPLKAMEWLSTQCPRIDFVINWNATSAKRNRSVFGNHHIPSLEEVIARSNKTCWLIRQPITANQFTLIIGRTIKIGEHRSLGFYDLYSSRGREIFNRCNLTAEVYESWQLERQKELFSLEPADA